jgi:hypothetical protein
VQTTPVAPPVGPSANCPGESPARIFDTLLYGHARTEALKAAIELEVFTAIAEGWRTAEPLAQRCSASPRGIAALCDFLVVNGFLTKSHGEYGLAPDSQMFLDKRSPAYCGSVAGFLAGPHNARRAATIADCVRAGHAMETGTDTVDQWIAFAASMVPMAAPSAASTAQALRAADLGPVRVLDVAASHGEYSLAILRKNPRATAAALDLPGVVDIGARRAQEQGFSDRYATIAGSVFDVPLGGPYDLVLLPNILHQFSEVEIDRVLRKVAATLAPGGKVATVEFVVNDDRVSPHFPALFAMTMLTGTNGDAYTFAQLDAMMRRAGLTKSRAVPLPPTPQTLIISES